MPDNSGIRVKVKVVKNKVAAPFKAVMLDILFGTGIDSMGCMVDAAQELGIVERKGSWYAYNGANIAQGRVNAVEVMKNDSELAASIEEEVRSALVNYGKDESAENEQDEDEEEVEFEETAGMASEGINTTAANAFE